MPIIAHSPTTRLSDPMAADLFPELHAQRARLRSARAAGQCRDDANRTFNRILFMAAPPFA
jgi:hypothetical protein